MISLSDSDKSVVNILAQFMVCAEEGEPGEIYNLKAINPRRNRRGLFFALHPETLKMIEDSEGYNLGGDGISFKNSGKWKEERPKIGVQGTIFNRYLLITTESIPELIVAIRDSKGFNWAISWADPKLRMFSLSKDLLKDVADIIEIFKS